MQNDNRIMGILRNIFHKLQYKLSTMKSLIFTEIYGVPPRMKFSFQLFKDYTISSFKVFT